MTSLITAHRANRCASRRELLRLSSLGLLGLSLPSDVRAETELPAIATAKHCIFIFLYGGPSQNDLWDLKPEAPDGIRSVCQAIDTNVPGIRFGELIPQVARHADKLASIRSMTHDDNGQTPPLRVRCSDSCRLSREQCMCRGTIIPRSARSCIDCEGTEANCLPRWSCRDHSRPAGHRTRDSRPDFSERPTTR